MRSNEEQNQAFKMPCKHAGGYAHSVSPHHSVTLELSIPVLGGDLHKIMVGVGFECGCHDDFGCEDDYKTYSWLLRNKTDNIVIDSGTVCPHTDWKEAICHKGITIIAEDILLDYSDCQRGHRVIHTWFWLPPHWEDVLHIYRMNLDRLYFIFREWRGKTLEFVLSCPDNSTKLSISSNVATSTYY